MDSSLGLLGLGLGFIVIVSIIMLAFYVLAGIGFYTMAKNERIDNAWLAFVPLGNLWIIGELISEKLGGNGGLKMIIFTIIAFVINAIPFLGLVSIVFYVMIIYFITSKYSESPILHTVLSVIFPIYIYIFAFVVRDRRANY